jgi:hypothetical protein
VSFISNRARNCSLLCSVKSGSGFTQPHLSIYFVYIYLSICLSVCLSSIYLSSVYLSICLSVCLSVFYLSVCLSSIYLSSVYLSICLSVCLSSIYLSVCLLSIYLSVCLSSIYLSVCLLSIYLSIYLSVCLSVCLSIHPCLWLYSLLLGPWPFFSFLIFLHRRWDSLDGRSSRRKAATYTQDNTNTEYTHTDIHALSGIRTDDPSVWAGEDSSCLRPRGHFDRPTKPHIRWIPWILS